DLGASAAFVAEPEEPSIDRRPPHDPRIPFLDAAKISGIAAGGFALWVAVFAPYWVSLYGSIPLAVAQTYAFSAWMIGHVLLALFSRSAHDPLHRIGLLSNRVLLLWMAGALGFLATALLVPAVGQLLNVVPVPMAGTGTIMIFVFLCMAGFELAKIVKAGQVSPSMEKRGG
ncbi:MAG: cation transporting ATPase C-terminal domain-containing protein, partial [Methanomicrobiales archaeon]|nr:cation transporting ATPase C-terminal domain-containing protein [Methanomicrobiales archaeon]